MRRDYIVSGFIGLLWFLATLILVWIGNLESTVALMSMLIFAVVLLGIGLALPETQKP